MVNTFSFLENRILGHLERPTALLKSRLHGSGIDGFGCDAIRPIGSPKVGYSLPSAWIVYPVDSGHSHSVNSLDRDLMHLYSGEVG